MNKAQPRPGVEELRAARRESRGLYWMVGIFSFFANMLMLTGPLYMLQVYDRVLGSRSEETLVALLETRFAEVGDAEADAKRARLRCLLRTV